MKDPTGLNDLIVELKTLHPELTKNEVMTLVESVLISGAHFNASLTQILMKANDDAF